MSDALVGGTPAPIVIKAREVSPLVIKEPARSPGYTLTGMNVGPQGPVGPPGANGSPGTSYEHTQASASALWTVAHNLGFRPAVSILTTGGVEILGGEILHLSVNTLQITFDEAFAGSARLN